MDPGFQLSAKSFYTGSLVKIVHSLSSDSDDRRLAVTRSESDQVRSGFRHRKVRTAPARHESARPPPSATTNYMYAKMFCGGDFLG